MVRFSQTPRWHGDNIRKPRGLSRINTRSQRHLGLGSSSTQKPTRILELSRVIDADHCPDTLLFDFEEEQLDESQTDTTNKVPYHLQGNPKFDRPEALEQRNNLRSDPRIRHAIEQFWWLVDVDGSGSIDKETYVGLLVAMQKALFSDTFDLKVATAQAHADWDHDNANGLAFTLETMMTSLFELADLWTNSLDAVDYVSFLKKLFYRVSAPGSPLRRVMTMARGGFGSRGPRGYDSEAIEGKRSGMNKSLSYTVGEEVLMLRGGRSRSRKDLAIAKGRSRRRRGMLDNFQSSSRSGQVFRPAFFDFDDPSDDEGNEDHDGPNGALSTLVEQPDQNSDEVGRRGSTDEFSHDPGSVVAVHDDGSVTVRWFIDGVVEARIPLDQLVLARKNQPDAHEAGAHKSSSDKSGSKHQSDSHKAERRHPNSGEVGKHESGSHKNGKHEFHAGGKPTSSSSDNYRPTGLKQNDNSASVANSVHSSKNVESIREQRFQDGTNLFESKQEHDTTQSNMTDGTSLLHSPKRRSKKGGAPSWESKQHDTHDLGYSMDQSESQSFQHGSSNSSNLESKFCQEESDDLLQQTGEQKESQNELVSGSQIQNSFSSRHNNESKYAESGVPDSLLRDSSNALGNSSTNSIELGYQATQGIQNNDAQQRFGGCVTTSNCEEQVVINSKKHPSLHVDTSSSYRSTFSNNDNNTDVVEDVVAGFPDLETHLVAGMLQVGDIVLPKYGRTRVTWKRVVIDKVNQNGSFRLHSATATAGDKGSQFEAFPAMLRRLPSNSSGTSITSGNMHNVATSPLKAHGKVMSNLNKFGNKLGSESKQQHLSDAERTAEEDRFRHFSESKQGDKALPMNEEDSSCSATNRSYDGRHSGSDHSSLVQRDVARRQVLSKLSTSRDPNHRHGHHDMSGPTRNSLAGHDHQHGADWWKFADKVYKPKGLTSNFGNFQDRNLKNVSVVDFSAMAAVASASHMEGAICQPGTTGVMKPGTLITNSRSCSNDFNVNDKDTEGYAVPQSQLVWHGGYEDHELQMDRSYMPSIQVRNLVRNSAQRPATVADTTSRYREHAKQQRKNQDRGRNSTMNPTLMNSEASTFDSEFRDLLTRPQSRHGRRPSLLAPDHELDTSSCIDNGIGISVNPPPARYSEDQSLHHGDQLTEKFNARHATHELVSVTHSPTGTESKYQDGNEKPRCSTHSTGPVNLLPSPLNFRRPSCSESPSHIAATLLGGGEVTRTTPRKVIVDELSRFQPSSTDNLFGKGAISPTSEYPRRPSTSSSSSRSERRGSLDSVSSSRWQSSSTPRNSERRSSFDSVSSNPWDRASLNPASVSWDRRNSSSSNSTISQGRRGSTPSVFEAPQGRRGSRSSMGPPPHTQSRRGSNSLNGTDARRWSQSSNGSNSPQDSHTVIPYLLGACHRVPPIKPHQLLAFTLDHETS